MLCLNVISVSNALVFFKKELLKMEQSELLGLKTTSFSVIVMLSINWFVKKELLPLLFYGELFVCI